MANSATSTSDKTSSVADENSPRPKRRSKYVTQACAMAMTPVVGASLAETGGAHTLYREVIHPDLHAFFHALIRSLRKLCLTEYTGGCSNGYKTLNIDSGQQSASFDHYTTPLQRLTVQCDGLPLTRSTQPGLHQMLVCNDLDLIHQQSAAPPILEESECVLSRPNPATTSVDQTNDPASMAPATPQLHFEDTQWADTGRQHFSHVNGPEPEYILSRLYPNQKMSSLLKCWFDELETYYPCVDRIDFYDRLSNLFVVHCECKDGMTRIPKQAQHTNLAALACGMMSLAAYFGGDLESSRQMQEDKYCVVESTSWYLESRRLLEYNQQSLHEPSLDLLRLQIVYVLYMTIHADPHGMCRSMTVAVDLALALKLNDECSWVSLSDREKEYHRLLWWTVYHMDRRVALRSGRSILIHDASFVVGDFTAESKSVYLDANPCMLRSDLAAQDQLLSLQWEIPSPLSTEWFDYLLFTIRWTKLVSKVWDKVLGLKAVRRPDVAMLAEADEYLIQLHQSMPTTLFWNSDQLPHRIGQGRLDTRLRLQLICFEMINCLRLLLRTRSVNNQLTQQLTTTRKSPQVTEAIASNTIESIVRYLSARKDARPWATYAGLRIVELSHDIATVIKSQQFEPTETTYKVVTSITWAQRCLQNMNMKASYVAAGKLATLLRDVNGIVGTRIPRLITFSCEEEAVTGDDGRVFNSSEVITSDFDQLFCLEGFEDGLPSSINLDRWSCTNAC